MSLVEKGKLCMATTKEVLQDIESGKIEVANTKLVSMQRDAAILVKEADKLAQRLEGVDEHYQKKDAELQEQIGILGVKENQVRETKKKVESELAAQRSVLQDKQSQLSSAESSLQSAERKLENAKKEKERQVNSGIGIGFLVGWLLLGPINGVFTGATTGAVLEACNNEVKAARSVRNHRSEDVDQAKSAIRSSVEKISSHLSQIECLASKIQDLNQKHCKLHDRRSKIKEAIPIIKNSTTFWLLFKQLSEHGEDRTLLLKKIVTHANKKDGYKVFQSSASQCVVNTFMESWESIATCAAEGCSDHMFSIEYACADCGSGCKALPHLRGSEFICSTCQLALAQ